MQTCRRDHTTVVKSKSTISGAFQAHQQVVSDNLTNACRQLAQLHVLCYLACVKKCAEADAAAQMQQKSDAVQEEEERAMLKHKVASLVSEKDRERRANHKACIFFSSLYAWSAACSSCTHCLHAEVLSCVSRASLTQSRVLIALQLQVVLHAQAQLYIYTLKN